VAWTHGINQTNAIPLANTFKNKKGDSRQGYWFEQVRKTLNETNADYLIISAEGFSSVAPARLSKVFARELPEHAASMKVIAYVRPHASRLLAAFIQRTKTGGLTSDFESFFSAVLKHGAFEYLPRFSKWRKVFGDRFVLRPYVRSELRGEDSVKDFFGEILGDVPFTIAESSQRNISPSLRTLAGLHFFHTLLDKAGVKFRVRSFMAKGILASSQPSGSARGKNPVLDRATVETLIATYRDDAKAMDAAFFSRPLLLESLENSLRDTGESPIDLTAESNFDEAERIRLKAIIGDIAKLVLENQNVWTLNFQVARERVVPTEDQLLELAKHRPRLEKIDALVAEMTGIFRG
jgi:hypothetical protein